MYTKYEPYDNLGMRHHIPVVTVRTLTIANQISNSFLGRDLHAIKQ